MLRLKNIYAFLLPASAFALAGCYVDNDFEVCDYNVKFDYHYNRENTANANLLDEYVDGIREYFFDAGGVLYAVGDAVSGECDGILVSEHTLPPGRWSVISWGNMTGLSRVAEAQVGVTRREDMLMAINSASTAYPGYQSNGDRLFYAYRTFTVNETGITRMRVDVLHSHLVLSVKVRWLGNPPSMQGEYQLRLRQNVSQYGFMPEYISRNEICRPFALTDDDYASTGSEVIHHIPRVLQDRPLVQHCVNSRINADSQVHGEFVALRLRNDTPAVVSLHLLPAVPGGEEYQVMKDVNLDKFFRSHNIDLDRTLRQEYELEFIIAPDGTVTVIPLSVADWDEGGVIKG